MAKEYIERGALLEELQEEIDFESLMYTKEQDKWLRAGLSIAARDVRNQPTADVVPRGEVGKDIDVATKELAKKICCEIEEEICAALDSNYKALRTYDDGRNNDYILELVSKIKGKIDALRGIEAFVEELKEKCTKGGEGE